MSYCFNISIILLSILFIGCGPSSNNRIATGKDIGSQVAPTPDPETLKCDNIKNGQNESRVRYIASSVNYQSTCSSEIQTRSCNEGSFSEWSGSYEYETCTIIPVKNCMDTPHGGQEIRIMYEAASVPFGGLCNSETQTRSCNDGTLAEWSGTYTNTACVVNAAASCGQTPHGGTELRLMYASDSVPYGNQCVSETQTRSCNNGILSDWTGNYNSSNCAPAQPSDCGSTPHGGNETRIMYATTSVPFNNLCDSETQTRSCNNGTLSSWSGSYTSEGCTVEGANNCGDTPHLGAETRTMYLTASVPHGEQCTDETQTRTCNDGSLSQWTGSYTADGCTVNQPMNCEGLDHGSSQSQLKYESATVPYGEVCVSETQSRSCDNGVISDWTGAFTANTCVIEGGSSCGDTAHGDYDIRMMYETATVPYGETCSEEPQSRLCTNGDFSNWTGTYTIASCTPDLPANCGATLHGGTESRIMYENATVPAGQLCVDETQTRSCNNGSLSLWTGTYSNISCDVLNPDNILPVANAGNDAIYTEGTNAILDGGLSSDADGNIVSYSWVNSGSEIATAAIASVSLPVGVHNIELKVTDNDGAVASDFVVITVEAGATPTPGTHEFQLTGDTYISEKYQSTNYHSKNIDSQIVIRSRLDSPQSHEFLMNFTVSGLGSATIQSAVLYMTTINDNGGSPSGGDFYSCSENFIEDTVSYSNAPDAIDLIVSIGAVADGQEVPVDLSSFITGDGDYCLRVKNTDDNSVIYHSREGAIPPRIEVITGN